MPDPVTYTAVLPIGEPTVAYLSSLLAGERVERRTRKGRRALGCYRQAVLVLRWFLDATRITQLATDNQLSSSTAYRYLHEGIDVLAAAPSLHGALLAARVAGHSHVHLDGTLVPTDRCKAPGPTVGVDLWWSGKHPAPRRRPVVYPTQSGGIGGIFLGLMPNLAPKGQGNNSMAGNRRSCPGVWNEVPGGPRDMVNGWIA